MFDNMSIVCFYIETSLMTMSLPLISEHMQEIPEKVIFKDLGVFVLSLYVL